MSQELRNLIDAVKKEREKAKAALPDVPTGVSYYLEKKGLKNVNPNFQQRMIDTFQKYVDKHGSLPLDYERYIKKWIEQYYAKKSYTIEIIEKDRELRDEMKGYVYRLTFQDKSYYEGLYVWNLRITYFPVEAIGEKVMADVEKELMKQDVKLADVAPKTPWC